MSAIPAYFKGGIAPGSHVNVTYIGDLQTDPVESVRIIAVTGEDPDTIDNKHISFTVTGTIIGSTANTITLQTDDGAIDTFRTENAQDLTEGSMEYGDYVVITFHPSKSKSSNIYTAVKNSVSVSKIKLTKLTIQLSVCNKSGIYLTHKKQFIYSFVHCEMNCFSFDYFG